MDYTLHKGFLTQDQCSWILEYAEAKFKDDTRLGWSSSTNQSEEFAKDIEKILSPIIDYTKWKPHRIGIAQYEVGKGLQPHVDGHSALTMVTILTDDFKGGEFYLDKKHIPLELGDVLIFNGNKLMHSVNKIKEGYRVSLSVWFIPNTLKPII